MDDLPKEVLTDGMSTEEEDEEELKAYLHDFNRRLPQRNLLVDKLEQLFRLQSFSPAQKGKVAVVTIKGVQDQLFPSITAANRYLRFHGISHWDAIVRRIE